MNNLDSILKSRDITFPTKVHLIKAMVFPVVMYGYESWTTKKAECWRIYAFQLRCWRRILSIPWITRRSNQSILKKISPEYSLEGLMLKLKLQYFGHLMWRTDSFVKTWGRCWGRLKVGGEEDNRGWDGWMASTTQWTGVWVGSRSWWWTGKSDVLQSMGWQSQTWLNNWTELNSEPWCNYLPPNYFCINGISLEWLVLQIFFFSSLLHFCNESSEFQLNQTCPPSNDMAQPPLQSVVGTDCFCKCDMNKGIYASPSQRKLLSLHFLFPFSHRLEIHFKHQGRDTTLNDNKEIRYQEFGLLESQLPTWIAFLLIVVRERNEIMTHCIWGYIYLACTLLL